MRTLCAVALALAMGCQTAGPQKMDAGRGPSHKKACCEARKASFEARNEFKVLVPEGAKNVRAWFAMPQDDPAQKVENFKVECPFPHRIAKDSEGNSEVYVEVTDPSVKEFTLVETFSITRCEQKNVLDPAKTRPITASEMEQFAKFLQPNEHVVINDEIKTLAAQIVGSEKNPVTAARKIYDWVLANIEYWVKTPDTRKASPVGSSTYCLANKTGNCTDFHSLWTALARAAGIPTRMVYGSFFKKELDGKDRDQSYHCWPEFFVPGAGWVPHDVAVADIFVGDFTLDDKNGEKVRLTTADGYISADPAKVDYYFGSIDERRVTWSRGRDLTMSPKQSGAPVNAMAKAHVEVDGQIHPETKGWTRKLTFKDIPTKACCP